MMIKVIGKQVNLLIRVLVAVWVLTASSLSVLAQDLTNPNRVISFTDAEKTYISAHPVIEVATISQNLPFSDISASNVASGMSVDFLNVVKKASGLNFVYRSFTSVLQANDAARKAGETAWMVASVGYAEELKNGMRFSAPYFNSPFALLARKGATETGPAVNLTGRKVGVVPGSASYFFLKKQYPGALFEEYPTIHAALDGLVKKKSDLLVGQLAVAQYYVEHQEDNSIEIIRQWRPDGGSVRFGFSESNEVLAGIVTKVLASIDETEIQRIHARWSPVRQYLAMAPNANFTQEQMQRIRSVQPLRVGIDANFAPYSFLSESGTPQGIAIDYLELLSKRIGLPVGEVKAGRWSDILAMAQRGELDLLVAVAANPERREKFVFVGPYAATPTAIAASPKDPLVTLSGLKGVQMAILKDHFLLGKLKASYPAIDFREYPTMNEVILAASEGQARGAIGNLEVVAQTIGQLAPGALLVTGLIENGSSELYFGLRNELADLAPLLSNAMLSVPESESAAIRQKWARNQIKVGVSPKTIFQYAVPAALIALAVIGSLWWRRLQLQARLTEKTQSERLANELAETRGRYIAVLGHEIRTPLNALVSATDAIDTGKLTLKDQNLVVAARSNARSILDTLNDILAWLKGGAIIEGVRPRPTSIALLLLETADHFRGFATQRQIQISVAIDPELAPVHMVDPIRLRQIFVNLISNALRHNVEVGEVVVRIRADQTNKGRQRLVFECVDHGPGLSAEQLAQVMADQDKEFNLSTNGIGLSLSRHYLKAMGSDLQITNETPRGVKAVFALTLALVNASERKAVSDSERLLIVDEDRLSSVVAANEMDKRGYLSDCCDDPLKALDMWAAKKYSIVIVDLQMKTLSGVELIRMLRSFGANFNTSIIGLQSDPDNELADQAIAAGASHVLPKPLRYQELLQTLRR